MRISMSVYGLLERKLCVELLWAGGAARQAALDRPSYSCSSYTTSSSVNISTHLVGEDTRAEVTQRHLEAARAAGELDLDHDERVQRHGDVGRRHAGRLHSG